MREDGEVVGHRSGGQERTLIPDPTELKTGSVYSHGRNPPCSIPSRRLLWVRMGLSLKPVAPTSPLYDAQV